LVFKLDPNQTPKPISSFFSFINFLNQLRLDMLLICEQKILGINYFWNKKLGVKEDGFKLVLSDSWFWWNFWCKFKDGYLDLQDF